jgi:hypothetical protein
VRFKPPFIHYHAAMPVPFVSQLRSNAVALISLGVAIAGLTYNTWRNERTEHNRNIRQAAFQQLVALGQLKQLVYHAHYDHDTKSGNPRTGWAYVETIQDFAANMPPPVPMKDQALLDAWREHWEGLGQDDSAAESITNAIDDDRAAVVLVLKMLR